MMELQHAFGIGAAGSALLAAVFWAKASRAYVPAPEDTSGVGALLGGYLISEVNGKRIDLHKTLELQSKWNAYGAVAAAAAAVFSGLPPLANFI